MGNLRFFVKGSARQPYRVTTEGQGEKLRIFCTCPAGKRGGRFCKHVAALLVGDVSNLVEPSDSVKELADLAADSPLLHRALEHQPKSEPVQIGGISSLTELYEKYAAALKAAGWDVELVELGDEAIPSSGLALYGYFKNGKRRKTPSYTITYTEKAGDLIDREDGRSEWINLRRRARPWNFDGRTWSRLSPAATAFLTAAGVTP